MFRQEMRTKLPELRREPVEVPREESRDRDWSNKLKGKAYAHACRGATLKSIQIGDTVLLKAEKSNKLSTNFCPSPFKVVQKTGTEETVRNQAGEEFRRNSAFIKKYNEQDNVSGPNGKKNSWPEPESWTEGKSCRANDDRSVWKQASASSEFVGKGR